MRLVVVLDCVDADALAGFWASALGFDDDGGYFTAVLADPQGNEFCVIRPPNAAERLADS
jgi:hypothetical protein